MFVHFSVVLSVAEGTSSPLATGMRSFAALRMTAVGETGSNRFPQFTQLYWNS